ncbi:hypothetical protein AB0D37_38590 [Streptomyces sp. NPDC048384]|uniref:hypothetical protein n=1 Tax=Streptomyces sp. NPDC048384 TaxID=3155487 RepID=UPI00343F03FB
MSFGGCADIIGPALLYCLKGDEEARKGLTLADCADKFDTGSPNYNQCADMASGGDGGGDSLAPSGGTSGPVAFLRDYAKQTVHDIGLGHSGLSDFLTDKTEGPAREVFQMAWGLGLVMAFLVTGWIVLVNLAPRADGSNIRVLMRSLGGLVLAVLLMQAIPLALAQLADVIAVKAAAGAGKDPAGGLFSSASKALDSGDGGPVGTILLSVWATLVGGAFKILYAMRSAALVLMLAVSPLVVGSIARGTAGRSVYLWLRIYAWLAFFPVLVSLGGAVSPLFGDGSLGVAVALGVLTLLVYGSWLAITKTWNKAKARITNNTVVRFIDTKAGNAATRIEEFLDARG